MALQTSEMNVNETTIPPIKIDGAYLYKGEQRFIVRGLIYQRRPRIASQTQIWDTRDSLNDACYDDLLHDVKAFRELGINALWIYHHDPTVSHTKCMSLLADSGIYVIFVLSTPNRSISRLRPRESYNGDLIQHFCSTIDSVAPYNNTLGVSVANSTIDFYSVRKLDNLNDCWSVIGKVVGDVKRHMHDRNRDLAQRILPVCISDGTWSVKNTSTFNYVADPVVEGRAANGRVDFYCFVYYGHFSAWRRSKEVLRNMEHERVPTIEMTELPASPADSDQEPRQETLSVQRFIDAQDPIPILISEYGNNGDRPRTFREVTELYGSSMSSPLLEVLSGGFVYQFYESSQGFGLLAAKDGGGREKLPDFYNFHDTMYDAIGTTQPEIQRLMMTTSKRPIQLILDFDGTLSKKDTLHIVAAAGYNRQTLDSRDPPPAGWKDIVKAYQADYTAHENSYGRTDSVQASVGDEFAWLDSLSKVETASADRVFAAGIFDNVTKQDMEIAAADAVTSGEIQLRDGWARLLARIEDTNKHFAADVDENLSVQLLSVNWSRWFIWNVLNKSLLTLDEPEEVKTAAAATLEKLAVYANEIPSVTAAAQHESSSGVSSAPRGQPTPLRTAGDKFRQMMQTTTATTTTTTSKVVAPAGLNPCRRRHHRPLTVYIGDSATDLQCLLTADVGICIAAPTLDHTLQQTCERLRVEVTSLADYPPRLRRRQSERGRGGRRRRRRTSAAVATTVEDLQRAISAGGGDVTLYHARDFVEVAEWVRPVSSDEGEGEDEDEDEETE